MFLILIFLPTMLAENLLLKDFVEKIVFKLIQENIIFLLKKIKFNQENIELLPTSRDLIMNRWKFCQKV
jgi:hypothetical protein